jgi:hypothetical protein
MERPTLERRFAGYVDRGDPAVTAAVEASPPIRTRTSPDQAS